MRNYSKTYYKKWPIIDFLRLSISCWDLRGPKVLKFWGSRTESVGKTCQPVPGFFSARIDFLTGKLGRADVRFCVYLRSSLGRHWSEPKARSEKIFCGLVCYQNSMEKYFRLRDNIVDPHYIFGWFLRNVGSCYYIEEGLTIWFNLVLKIH